MIMAQDSLTATDAFIQFPTNVNSGLKNKCLNKEIEKRIAPRFKVIFSY